MPLLLPGSDWSSEGATSLGLDTGGVTSNFTASIPTLSLPEIPSYNLVSSPSFSDLNFIPSPTVPESSGGVLKSLSDWFKTPSNSGVTQAVLSTSGGLAQTVASFFKGNNSNPSKANNSGNQPGQPSSGLMNSLFGGLSNAWQSTTQGLGTGLGNITAGTTRPLIPMLFLIVIGLFLFFLIWRR
ncbi:MAG: hypothetical protein KGL39_39495 [Patescibacteria group bacterium]|nr:hypothetical protein [Patescibacteria group bacterium]